jgi:hypothetical protein
MEWLWIAPLHPATKRHLTDYALINQKER